MGIWWPCSHFIGNLEKILVMRREGSPPMLIVVSRPCERYCEARESALVNTLRYISDILAYEINDLDFFEYWHDVGKF